MTPKKNKKYWLKIAISLAVTLSISFVIKISCQKINFNYGSNLTDQSGNSGTLNNLSGNTINVNNALETSVPRDFKKDKNAGARVYDELKGPKDPPWESLAAKDKAYFIELASKYVGSQFDSLNTLITATLQKSAGNK